MPSLTRPKLLDLYCGGGGCSRGTLYRIRPGASAFLRQKFTTPPAIGRLVEVQRREQPAVGLQSTCAYYRFTALPDETNPATAFWGVAEADWPQWKPYLEEVEA